MFPQKPIRNLICAWAAAFMLSGGMAQFALGQMHGAVDMPPTKPRIDQLGQMENVSRPDRVVLALFLFLQVVTCVAVGISLSGHWSMPPKRKKKVQ